MGMELGDLEITASKKIRELLVGSSSLPPATNAK
jgi:hypothetical protein